MADLSDQIETAAATPAAASVDGQSVTSRGIADLITADQYLAVKEAVAKRRRGLAFTKLINPGAAPDEGGLYYPVSFNSGGWTG